MITRESYWGAHGAHSQQQWIKIKDLDDTHLNNIIKMLYDEGLWKLMVDTMDVLVREFRQRGFATNPSKLEWKPYTSHATGELITDGRY